MRRPGAEAGGRFIAPGVLLLAFGLRVYRLGAQNVWWDEAFSVWVARHGLGTLTTIAVGDTHPPLYYWLLHLWMGLAGQSEFALRFPSLVAGVLAVALVYRLGRCLDRSRGTLLPVLAAGLLALSRFHVWWSQEIRMYSLAAMWATASSWALLEALRSRKARAWGLYLAATAAGMYSLYLYAFVVAAQGVFVLGRCLNRTVQARRDLAMWIGTQAGAVVALAPWLLYTLPRLKSWSAASQFSPFTYLQLYATVLVLGITTFVERYWPAHLVVIAVLIGGGLVARRRRGEGSLWLVASWLLVPALGIFVLLVLPQGLFYRPPLEARYQLLSVPALALGLAASTAALWRWRRAAGIVAGLAVVGLMAWALPGYYAGRHLRDDFQTMTRAVAMLAEPGDGLLLVSGDRFPLWQFQYDALPQRPQLPDVTTLSVVRVSSEDVGQVLAPLAQAHKRVWLAEVEKNLQDPGGLLASWLDHNRHAVWSEGYGYNRLSLYSADEVGPRVVTLAPQHASTSDTLAGGLRGYDLPVNEAGPGDTLRLVAYVETEPCTLTVRLVPEGGQPEQALAASARRLSGELDRVRFEVPVYGGTPAGKYWFELGCHSVQRLPTPVQVVDTPRLEPVGTIPNPRDLRVGDLARLAGFDLPVQVRAGGKLPVKLYWRTPQPIGERLTVFVQLVGAAFNPRTNGPLWAGHDSEPLNGGYPTTQWWVNTTIADTHVLDVPADTPPGEYEVWAGLYTLPDVKRLPVYDGQGNLAGDHVVLGRVKVNAR